MRAIPQAKFTAMGCLCGTPSEKPTVKCVGMIALGALAGYLVFDYFFDGPKKNPLPPWPGIGTIPPTYLGPVYSLGPAFL